MEQPLGYISNYYTKYVCKLKKVIYGLKQALEFGMVRLPNTYLASNSDASLFVKKKGSLHVIALL